MSVGRKKTMVRAACVCLFATVLLCGVWYGLYQVPDSRWEIKIIYGEFHENSKHTTRMPYMKPVYDVLEKNRGKVIYFDFWARWCPPCLAEMEPLKQLRSKFSTDDLIIYSICVSEPKEQWEECLNEYSLKNRGIECVHVTDYLGIDNYQKIRKQWKIDRMPYYVLINRKGQIIDFGTAARPSNPQLVSRIEEAVK